MDSRQLSGYDTTATDITYYSYPRLPSIQSRPFEPVKSDSTNSPSSPFSAHRDSENFTPLSNSPEQQSTSGHLSGASPSYNSSLDYKYHIQFSTPLDRHPVGGISFVHNAISGHNIKHTLRQLETALMEPDEEDEVTMPAHPATASHRPQGYQRSSSWVQRRQGSTSTESQPQPVYVSRVENLAETPQREKRHKGTEDILSHGSPTGHIKDLLIACATALSENNMVEFDELVEKSRSAVSISGEPIQRLGAYMLEGLIARKEESGHNIYRALRCKEPAGKELLSYMHILYEICPYFKFGYMAANGAIAEACRNDDYIHIVDFQIAQGTQWMTLLQALAARPSGAPHVRITGIDDPVSQYARGDGLVSVGKRLAAISEKFNIPVEFHAVPVFAPEVTREMLNVRAGEALAVNFPLQLHHTPDESVNVNNPRDGLLRMVKSLSPKVVTLVEQESNTNTAPFLPRFLETLDYYSAIFESIDVTMPRDRKERINVEQHCLARDIVNIIACEGEERVERHELFGKWKLRLTMAGFQQYPLSSYVNSVIRGLLKCYSENYTLLEKDGALLLGWKDRNLISASAWH
ncbi:hypothetical protein Leryth_013560 [Lithospermum erythrorhizon]|nr:hypothetical protein Leryth_013560 [Lithospermum erythrorhizon]